VGTMIHEDNEIFVLFTLIDLYKMIE
jgi:hypothetical protein